ncbi:MAG: manganese efflux pump [Eggerthellaceae bacterium]|nr:manganese efflux pump [Eggerthellaceae bacterium]
MSSIEHILIPVELSMDSFVVSLCKVLSFKKRFFGLVVLIFTIFAFFQTVMLIIRYYFSILFERIIAHIYWYIIFAIFLLLGIKILYGCIRYEISIKKQKKKEEVNEDLEYKYFKDSSIVSHMLHVSILGLTDSIDAFFTCFSYVVLHMEIVLAPCLIFAETFLFSFINGCFAPSLARNRPT